LKPRNRRNHETTTKRYENTFPSWYLPPDSSLHRTLSQASNDDETKPVITVTLEPQRYFTEAIAGDKFKVVSMVPKGSSPETYDPIPQQLVSLGDSKAYFRIGYIGFEQTWMDRLMNNTPHIQVFDTSERNRPHTQQ